jgi:hypothetical protein
VTHEPLLADLDHLRAALERTQAVGRQLIGLHVDDARQLATRSLCHFRVLRRNGKGSIRTAELDTKRINVSTEDDIVVDFSTG